MKKRYIILLVAVVLISILCIWQRNNIKALYLFARYDKADIEKMLEESNKELEKKIEKYSDYLPRTLTSEEEARIASGELSIEEATELLIGDEETVADGTVDVNAEKETQAESESANKITEDSLDEEKNKAEKASGTEEKNNTAGTTKVTASDSGNKKEGEIIRNYTAQFYSLKAYYIGQLSQIETGARKDYAAMSKEEKKNLSKTTFINKYMSHAMALQGECDSKVDSLLKSMKEELKEVGGNTSIIGVIQQAYENEKAARKAYYMNMVS